MTDDVAQRLSTDVEFLCSRVCAGREAGSAEGIAARNYIVDQLTQAMWTPVLQPVPGCRGANVIAHKRGTGNTVLVAAHYDHIGRAMGDEAYWGADDNAAAVALVLELARRFSSEPACDLMLVAFDGEEPPHFLTDEMGSIHFTAHPPVPLASIAVAIVLDLVGHAVGPAGAPPHVRNSLFVLGAEKTEGLPASVAAARGDDDALSVRCLDLDVVPALSDYEPFRRHGVPVLFLTGGRWRHYHELTDTPDKLDYAKVAATVDFVARLIGECARPLGRYEAPRRAWATTATSIAELAQQLVPSTPQAKEIVINLAPIRPRLVDGGSIAPADHGALLMALMKLEQLIA